MDFVGAGALADFTVVRNGWANPRSAFLREAVTVLEQIPGLPEQPPITMTVRLVDGVGSDVQALGYDESPLPPAQRPVARETAEAWWRRYRQELYMDNDEQPFAVIDWRHKTTGIRILRVEGPRPRPETAGADNRRIAVVR